MATDDTTACSTPCSRRRLLLWELGGQPAQLIDRLIDLVVRLGALRRVQLHRGVTQTAVGAAEHRSHHLQIARQLHHRRRCRTLLALPLRLMNGGAKIDHKSARERGLVAG